MPSPWSPASGRYTTKGCPEGECRTIWGVARAWSHTEPGYRCSVEWLTDKRGNYVSFRSREGAQKRAKQLNPITNP